MEEFELEPGEVITLQVRKHWIVLVFQMIGLAVIAAVPLLVFPALSYLATIQPVATAMILKNIAAILPYVKFAVAFYWLFIWMAAYSFFITYYLTTWIITTTRIVDIHQYGFFSRKVSSFLLNRVQDVTIEMEGFLPTMFSFGSLDVETAGRTEQFSMDDIVNPQGIRDLILREVDALNGGSRQDPYAAPSQPKTGI
jgi:uncharacterized membrane protein YdbT with pleckstrin-like domain